MRVWKFKRRIEIDKTIGNFNISTFHYGAFDKKGKRKNWTELHCWYKRDCEHCPLSWADIDYWGECNDCGCYMAKHGKDYPRTSLVCMLPRWIKKILLRRKEGEYMGKLFNHAKIAYMPIKCSDCHKIIWLDSYITGKMPHEKTKRLCKNCATNYTLNEFNGKYFLKRCKAGE